jgi:hypothetical protein
MEKTIEMHLFQEERRKTDGMSPLPEMFEKKFFFNLAPLNLGESSRSPAGRGHIQCQN